MLQARIICRTTCGCYHVQLIKAEFIFKILYKPLLQTILYI